MSTRMDVKCHRCGSHVGTARIHIPLALPVRSLSLGANTCPVMVNHEDLDYWKERHTKERCDEVVRRLESRRLATIACRREELREKG